MYFVKTRNWHSKRWVKFFLDISHLWVSKEAIIMMMVTGSIFLKPKINYLLS